MNMFGIHEIHICTPTQSCFVPLTCPKDIEYNLQSTQIKK